MEKVVRKALKSGSWYPKGNSLSSTVDKLLKKSKDLKSENPIKALIGPHAGYSYCAQILADAYKNVLCHKGTSNITTVFVLGPSHRYGFNGLALSSAHVCKTSIGELDVDTTIVKDLMSTKMFEQFDVFIEENEHSIELHLPFVKKCFKNIKIVPIMVSKLDENDGKKYAKVLYKYFKDPKCFFAVSSDFCHWGYRFGYTHFDKDNYDKPYKSIEALDKMGCDIIKEMDSNKWVKYLEKYKNTICGRKAILVLLQLFELEKKGKYKCELVGYSQSSKVTNLSGSSVSYAGLIFY